MTARLDQFPPAQRARLLKLLALAEGGVGGERETAAHGLTRDDLVAQATATRRVWLSYRTEEERRLAICLGTTVAGSTQFWTEKQGGRKTRRVGFELTPSQAAELAVQWECYRKAWKDAQALAYQAFRIKHDIGVRAHDDDDAPPVELTPEERRRIRAAMRLADSMPDVELRKRLGRGVRA